MRDNRARDNVRKRGFMDKNDAVQGEQLDDAAMQQEQEKLIPQSKVNELIQTAKMSERQKAEVKMQEINQQQQMEKQAAEAQQMQQTQAQPQVDVNEIANQAYERLKSEQEQRDRALEEDKLKRHYENVASTFHSKLSQGSEQFEDFNDTIKNFDFTKFPDLVELLADLPNVPAVVRELRRDTKLLTTINDLARTVPEMAREDLLKVSDSLNMNAQAKEALKDTRSEPPLDSVNPSRVTNSSGKRSFSEMRNDPKYRV